MIRSEFEERLAQIFSIGEDDEEYKQMTKCLGDVGLKKYIIVKDGAYHFSGSKTITMSALQSRHRIVRQMRKSTRTTLKNFLPFSQMRMNRQKPLIFKRLYLTLFLQT